MEPHLPDPLPLGPFDVERDGILALRDPPGGALLRFRWRGRPCEAHFGADGVQLGAIAGRVPSTANPAADRAGTFAALREMPPSLEEGWRVGLTPDHRIRVEAQEDIPMPATTTRLIAAMVRFALSLDPIIDRLDSAGAEPPPGSALN